jgi:hypothetical protein
MKNWKVCGRKPSGPNFNVLSWNLLGKTEENHKYISEDSQSPGRDLNPGLPKYEEES